MKLKRISIDNITDNEVMLIATLFLLKNVSNIEEFLQIWNNSISNIYLNRYNFVYFMQARLKNLSYNMYKNFLKKYYYMTINHDKIPDYIWYYIYDKESVIDYAKLYIKGMTIEQISIKYGITKNVVDKCLRYLLYSIDRKMYYYYINARRFYGGHGGININKYLISIPKNQIPKLAIEKIQKKITYVELIKKYNQINNTKISTSRCRAYLTYDLALLSPELYEEFIYYIIEDKILR